MKKKVLITGARGLIGVGLLKTMPKSYELIPTVLKNDNSKKFNFLKLDITDKKAVVAFFQKFHPEIIIHLASIGNVDYCQTHKKEATLVNVTGTKNLINEAKKINAKFVYISSNAVFDGNKSPYNEKSKPNPVNQYGKTKLKAEELVKKSGLDYLIVRLLLAYGWNDENERDNPVTWLIKRLKAGEKTPLVNDTFVNPILNLDAGWGIWSLIRKNKVGIYHLAGKDRVNRYEFGLLTAKVFNLNAKLISEVNSAFFKNIAKRMPDTSYDIAKASRDIGFKPRSLISGLKKMKSSK